MALTDLPLHRLIPALALGEVGPVDLVDAYLERIRRLDPKLHAFVALYEADARLAAEAAEKAIRSGHRASPFHGIPIAIKDVIEIAGRVTTGGSKVWQERISPVTATLVQKLVGAGMIVLGKTHTVEFALGGWGTNQHMGTPWNPWDAHNARSPGGSSSGSGVAVAARLAPCAIGTDTGGSVRLPSSFCGIVGLKTTIGRISAHGVLPLAPSLDTPGPMTRSVEDAALLLQLLQGPDPLDPKTLLAPPSDPFPALKRGVAGLTLAVLPASERVGVDPEVLSAYDDAAAVLARGGARLIEAPLPCPIEVYGLLSGQIMTTEGYAQMSEIVERADLPTDEDVRPRFLQSRSRTAREYLGFLREKEARKRDFAANFAAIDGFLTPTTPFAALALETIDQKSHPARFTRMVNGLDLCALALPNGFTRTGLPTSLQIIAKGRDEAMALRIGWAFEQATEWLGRRPPEI